MPFGATSKELLKLMKTKTGVILLSLAILAIFIMPTFAQANNTGMMQGQTTSTAAQGNMSLRLSNASSSTGNIGANIGSNNVIVNIMAKNKAFNLSTITVPAGAKVTINFDNQDLGVQHSIAFYTDTSASNTIYRSLVTTGPNKITDTFIAPSTPGTYIFRCDVHPTLMTGQFIVTPSTGSNMGSSTVNTSSSMGSNVVSSSLNSSIKGTSNAGSNQ